MLVNLHDSWSVTKIKDNWYNKAINAVYWICDIITLMKSQFNKLFKINGTSNYTLHCFYLLVDTNSFIIWNFWIEHPGQHKWYSFQWLKLYIGIPNNL